MDHFKIALVQQNPRVGQPSYNARVAFECFEEAVQRGADLVVFSEVFISGYPLDDLALEASYVLPCEYATQNFIEKTRGIKAAVIISTLQCVHNSRKPLNAALLVENGKILATRHKHELPNYDVFDEVRTTTAGPVPRPVEWRGLSIAMPICEDIWHPKVCKALKDRGAQIIISPNGSPYQRGKQHSRYEMARARTSETGLALLYANQIGGQDELVFDGGSFAMNQDGSIAVQASHFKDEIIIIEAKKSENGWGFVPQSLPAPLSDIEAAYRACVMGLRDYMGKKGFQNVLLGLSGGVDSALVATLAVDALGLEHVRVVMLPSRYTSEQSKSDAAQLAKNLGLPLDKIPIEPMVEAFHAQFTAAGQPALQGLAAENLQARVRGTTLMALSNASDALLLTTGNKSELAMGYATLYGDMCGGFNPIKDLYKTKVYEMCAWRNQLSEPPLVANPIPQSILTRAPSAELRDNQTDQDSLPPYEVLDAILERAIEGYQGENAIVEAGFERQTVRHVLLSVIKSQYKRAQAAPGPKLTSRNFGKGFRLPL